MRRVAVVDHIVLCGGVARSSSGHRGRILSLRLGDGDDEIRLRIGNITSRVVSNLPNVLIDLVEIASYVYCADQAITRGGEGVVAFGKKWRRRFQFNVPVREPEVWSSKAVLTTLQNTLGFLSDDEYEFRFSAQKAQLPMQAYLDLESSKEATDQIEEVLLFSGGVDSLGGAVAEAVRDKRRVALVSHRANPKIDNKQKLLVAELEERCTENKPLHIPVWVQKGEALDREYTQRSRSFLYAALAAVVARAFGLRRIRFYENGVVSLNLPISEQAVGGRATRTTHPQVLNGYASLFRLLTDGPFEVENPFLWLTKGEVVDFIGDSKCGELLKNSVTCTHTREMTRQFTHCGRCSQCIGRRFGTLSSKYAACDPAEIYKLDLLLGERKKDVDFTMLESFIRTAAQIRTMNEFELIGLFPEISRVLRHLQPLTSDEVATRVARLHQKHAAEVNQVLEAAWTRHCAQILRQELPATCGLLMAFPDQYRGTTATGSEPNGQRNGAEAQSTDLAATQPSHIVRSIGSRAAVKLLADLKGQKGWTMEELARHVGTTARTLQRFFKMSAVRSSVFRTMADRLGISPEDFLRGGASAG